MLLIWVTHEPQMPETNGEPQMPGTDRDEIFFDFLKVDPGKQWRNLFKPGQKLMKTESLLQSCWLFCSLMINLLPLLQGNPEGQFN